MEQILKKILAELEKINEKLDVFLAVLDENTEDDEPEEGSYFCPRCGEELPLTQGSHMCIE